MATWALRCATCGKVFTHSPIDGTLADYYLPRKPQFPDEGSELECPHCKAKSIYKQTDLRYQKED